MMDGESSFLTPARVRMLSGLGLGLLLVFGGWWWGRSAPLAQVASLQAQLAQSQAAAEANAKERDQVAAAGELLASHIAFLQTINQLDQRNFGLAEESLQRAREHLAKVDPAHVPGIDASELTALREGLAGTSLAVAADLNAQRQQLLALDARYQALNADR